MIGKKVLIFFLILIASFFVLALAWFLIQELPAYSGQCTYGLFDPYVRPCSLWHHLKNQLPWHLLIFYVVGLFWLAASVIFSLAYWFVLTRNKDLKASPRPQFRIYTLLGIVSGIGLTVALSLSGLTSRSSFKLYLFSLAITLALPIVIGSAVDRHKNTIRASS